MTDASSPVRRLRRMLVLSSALGTTTLGGLSAPAQAQSIPTQADVVRTQTNVLGFDPRVTNSDGNLNVNLRANNTVIDWNGFNIPENKTANFENGTFSRNIAVLNRDVSGNASQLLGKLTSDPGVAVWVYNPNGILVGSKASFNTGSLVLSTLDVNSSDFLAGGSNYRLGTGSGSTAAITVLNGAQIKVQGGNRGLVMVAPKIEAEGNFQAVGQDVAFVTATDVTLSYSASSPLSVTINRGTPVSGRSQYVRGTVAGQDALFALASQSTVTDALLQIDAGVTTATAGERGIILSAGKPGTAVEGVTVTGATADIGGVANLLVNGGMTVNDGGSDIVAGASGTLGLTGALSSQRDILLASDGGLSVTGAVSADRDYVGTGTGITLGNGSTLVQSAGRTVRLTASNGDLTGAAGLTLQSGGTAGLTLATTGTTAGNILLDPTSSLVGGDNRQGYVDIRQRDAGNGVALGNVTARALRQSIGSGAVANGLTTTGALVLGNVNVQDALTLNAAGLTAGSLASDRGVTIVSNGALATGAITARGGAVALTGSGSTTIGGSVAANGNFADLTITRDGAMSLAGLSATNDVAIDAGGGTVAVTGTVAAGMRYLVSGSGVTLGGTSPVTQAAKDVVTITAGAGGITGAQGLTLQSNSDSFGRGTLTLAVTAPSTTGIAFADNSTLLGGQSRQSDVQISLSDAASPITLGAVRAANLTGLNTTGALRMGNASILGDLVAQGASIVTGDLTSANGGVTLTSGTGDVTAGSIASAKGLGITSAGAVTVGRLSAQNGISVGGQGAARFGGDVTAGGAVTLSGASLALTGGTLSSGGAIDLLASSGGITSTGALAVTSTSNQATDFIRLQANGADGIGFASGSSITGGSSRALRVGIFNASADAPVRLGDVTARSLTALAAANGDAIQPGGAIRSNGALAFGALNLVDSFAAESLNGDLAVGRIAVTGNGQGISLSATKGSLSVQNNLSTSGDVTLVSGGALSLGTVESRDGRATLTSGGAVTLANLNGARGASVGGTQVSVDAVRGGPVALTASAGDVQVGSITGTGVTVGATGGSVGIRNTLTATDAVSLTATGDVRVGGALSGTGVVVNAQGNAGLLGGVQAGGDVTVSASAVTLGGVHSATGAYGITATAGGITAANGTSILSDSQGQGQGGKALNLTAKGDIAFDPTSSLSGGNGTSAVTLTTGGGAIGVGNVIATGFAANGASSIRTGDLTLGSGLSLAAAGGVTTGAINVGSGGVSIDAGGGTLTTGTIDAGDAVTLNGASLSFGRVGARALKATATGTLTGAAIATRGDTTLQGKGITTGDIGAANLSAVTTGDALTLGDLTLAGTGTLGGGAVRFGRVAATSLSATATGGLQGGDVTTQGAANANAAGALSLGTIDAGGAVGLGGSSVNVGTINATALSATSTTGGFVAGDIRTSGPVGITAAQGRLDLGQVNTVTGDVTLRAAGTLNAVGVTSGGAATLVTTGGNADVLLANGLDAVGAASVSATGNVRAPQILSRTSDLTVAAPNGELTGYLPGSGVALGAGPGRAFSLTIGAAARLGDVVGGKLTIVATSISAGRIDTGNEALELRATNGDLTVRGSVAGGTVTLGSSGQTSLNDVTAKGGLTLSGGSIGFGNATGTTIFIASTGAVNGGQVTSGGAIGVTGGSIRLAGLSGGGTVGAVASGGDLTLGGPVTGTDVTLGASSNAALGQVTAGGELKLTGGSVTFGDIAAASVDGQLTGALTGGTVRATNAASLRAASIGLDRASAGAGLALSATGGNLSLASLTAGGDAVLSASGAAAVTGNVTAGGAYRVTGSGVTLGGADGIVQKASGDVRITALSGDVAAGQGLTLTSDVDGAGAEALVLDAAGQIGFAGARLQARPGGGAALGLRAGRGRTIRLGQVEAARIGSFDGSTVAGGLTHDASLTTGDLTMGSLSVTLSRGDLSLGKVAATGAVALRSDAGAMTLGDLLGGSVDLASGGTLATGAMTSDGAVSLQGQRIEVGGRLAAARHLLAEARAALTLRDVSAGGAVTLKAGDTLNAGSVEGAGITANGAGIVLAGAKAGDTLSLTSSRDLTLNGGSAGGAATLDVAGLATIGGLTAGPSATITANDVALNGPLRAQTVAFVNRQPGTAAMRIGDGTGNDGLRLSDAEVRQVSADTLRFDAGSGAMEVGGLTLGSNSGRTVEMLGTGDVRVVGAVRTDGTGRSVRIGGTANGGNAANIHVVATRDGGGRLLFDGSDVELRGNRIAMGLAPGFIDTLQPGDAGLVQAQSLIGNGNSTLYNVQLGGGFYDPAATTTLSARSLTVRFGDYALFQNTAVPGEYSGLKIGGTPGAPVSPALRISSFGTPGRNGVALFGTINGIGGASAALLGNPVITIDPTLLPNSRINGCLAGSGAGCITTIVIQPTLQVFKWNSEEVFGITRDVAVPFSPVIGANNEELLSGLPELAPQAPQEREEEK